MDVALKQRLVGATVLIALAVIVLPMLLGGRPEEGAPETRKIEIPPQPGELDFETRRFPVGERPAPASPAAHDSEAAAAEPPGPRDVAHVELDSRDFTDALDAAEPAPAGETEEPGAEPPADAAAAAEAAAPGPQVTEPEVTEAEVTEAPAPAAKAAAATGARYVVQVASFGARENATRLTATLGGYGYAVLSDVVSSDVGELHRVRVGPYDTEAEARSAATRIKSQVDGVNPRVVDLQPDQAAQVTAPSDPLVRWVVQAGSFGSKKNADTLVEKLRGLGLSAYQESVSGAGGTVYRVRAGPFLERDEAIRANGLVRERLELDGVVMSAD